MNSRALVPLLPLAIASVACDDDDPKEIAFCDLDEGPDQAWFSLEHQAAPLETGGELQVECGFQGSFMIEIDPALGGFIPDAELVEFHVTLDVEGFNLGPNGHFAEGDFYIFVGCCEDYACYYVTRTMQLFPPDQVTDLATIHEAPARLEITMTTPDGPVVQTLDLQMWAIEQMDWQYCDY